MIILLFLLAIPVSIILFLGYWKAPLSVKFLVCFVSLCLTIDFVFFFPITCILLLAFAVDAIRVGFKSLCDWLVTVHTK